MIYGNQNKIIKSLTIFFITHFFYKQHFYKPRLAEIGKKTKQMPSNILRLNFCYLKNIYVLHPRYQLNIIGHILKNKQKSKCACIHMINHNENEDANEITWIT